VALSWIEYKNKHKILYCDLVDKKDSMEFIMDMDKSVEIHKKSTGKILELVNVTNYEAGFYALQKGVAIEKYRANKKTAIVGLSSKKKTLFNVFTQLAKTTDYALFENEEAAKEWLIKD
jgi:hypothetical protein